jgi:phytoene dehydrogenase-like protein
LRRRSRYRGYVSLFEPDYHHQSLKTHLQTGTTTAWALERSGFSVTLHETKNYIGGNAKSHTWKVNRRDVTTGLSVLAWPGHKFHNYNELMRTLNVPTVRHDLRFFIGRDDGECIYAHGRDSHRKERLEKEKPWLLEDLKRWEKCVNFVRAVNDFFCPPKTHRSVYRSSKLNPLNVISLWKLSHYVFGVSRKFWDDVFVCGVRASNTT